jgi:hypothetical protein
MGVLIGVELRQVLGFGLASCQALAANCSIASCFQLLRFSMIVAGLHLSAARV